MKSLLSIFSSESAASIAIPRHWWASNVLLLILLITAEIFARVVLAPIGDYLWAYDSTALSRSFEWYRQQAENGSAPRVVAIGDSTGARNFDPSSFSEAAAVDSVYSLARAANFPRAMRSNTLPLLDLDSVPDAVILMQSPDTLRDDPRTDQIEAGMVSSILEARLDGRFIITDFIYVTRLYRARSYLLDYWIRNEPLIRPAGNNGFSPFAREEGVIDNRNRPTGQLDETFRFSEMRREVTKSLLNIAEARQFIVIAVVGPYLYGTDYAVTNEHLAWLEELEQEHCEALVVLDMRTMPGLSPEAFKDNHHLYESGARTFSGALGATVRDLLDRDIPSRETCHQR
jgi:hypothetical protein